MRTTLIEPNYRWRGRAQDVLVCPRWAAFNHPLFSSRSPSTLPHVSPFRPRESAQDPPMLCTSLRVSWQVCTRIFLLSSLPRRSVTQPPLSFASLSTRPHRKEIKPHLTRWLSLSRTTVVLRGERSWNEPRVRSRFLSFSLSNATQKPRPERRDAKKWERNSLVGKARQVRQVENERWRWPKARSSCVQLNFNFALDIDAMPQ